MRHRVVILGAGFGGVSAAQHLSRHARDKDALEIVLVDQHRLHTYTPLLYEVVSGGLEHAVSNLDLSRGASVSFDLDGVLQNHPNVRACQEEVTAIHLQAKDVVFRSGKMLTFDQIILALGASSNTLGVPGVEEHALSLKHIHDALGIHDALHRLVHERTDDEPLELVIVGGGPTGVELAAELATSLRSLSKKRSLACSVTLVDAGSRILSSLPECVSRKAMQRLLALSVRVLLGTLVKEVGVSWVLLSPNERVSLPENPIRRDASHPADLVIWTAGVCANPAWAKWGLPVNERGYVKTNDTFQVVGHGDVWAIGDMAAMEGVALPKIAPEAIAQGSIAAQNVYRRFKREASFRHYKPKTWPFAIPLGGRHAIGSYANVAVNGFLGYVFRKAVDLKYFLDVLRPLHAVRVWAHGARIYSENDL
ncbi:MAG: FAD-dependent oxidoreductase [Patescibacteria group bacterium]